MGFELIPTQDKSYTLQIIGSTESMHHSGGAARETRYIYQNTIRNALVSMPEANTCVVGLGLGYIEISWGLCNPGPNAGLSSFEPVLGLVEAFTDWLDSADFCIYNDIVGFLSDSADISIVKKRLRDNFSLIPICPDIRKVEKQIWNIICYDAFSKKTNEDLWSEDFLSRFIKNHCAFDCVFTTYGCTSVLTKILKANDFEILERPGFSGKKNSTLAVRGKFTLDSAFRIF